jgi:hypothetical protein
MGTQETGDTVDKSWGESGRKRTNKNHSRLMKVRVGDLFVSASFHEMSPLISSQINSLSLKLMHPLCLIVAATARVCSESAGINARNMNGVVMCFVNMLVIRIGI